MTPVPTPDEPPRESERDAERFAFLQDKCSVTYTFLRNNGTSAMICGPINLRAAVDASMVACSVPAVALP